MNVTAPYHDQHKLNMHKMKSSNDGNNYYQRSSTAGIVSNSHSNGSSSATSDIYLDVYSQALFDLAKLPANKQTKALESTHQHYSINHHDVLSASTTTTSANTGDNANTTLSQPAFQNLFNNFGMNSDNDDPLAPIRFTNFNRVIATTPTFGNRFNTTSGTVAPSAHTADQEYQLSFYQSFLKQDPYCLEPQPLPTPSYVSADISPKSVTTTKLTNNCSVSFISHTSTEGLSDLSEHSMCQDKCSSLRPRNEFVASIISNNNNNSIDGTINKSNNVVKKANKDRMAEISSHASSSHPVPAFAFSSTANSRTTNLQDDDDTTVISLSAHLPGMSVIDTDEDVLSSIDDIFDDYKEDDDDERLCSASMSGEAKKASRFKPFHEEKWVRKYKELLKFCQEYGHAAVPHTFTQNPQLARWVKRQRRQYKLMNEGKTTTMTPDRLTKLQSVNFVWDSHQVSWREKFVALQDYHKVHGNCNVPMSHKDKKLHTWVKCQRRQYKLHKRGGQSAMCAERIAELESLGFEWELRPVL